MGMRSAVMVRVLRFALALLCKIDSAEYSAAMQGSFARDADEARHETKMTPMIIAVNHINFLEVPILVSHAYPTPVVGIIKNTTWKNPFMSFLLNTFDAIPLNRGGAYLETFENVKIALQNGACIGIAPEGSRSKTGVLQKGKAGIVQLAFATGAPILPVAHFGGQNFWENIKRFKRTPIRFKAGRPFYFKIEGERPARAERKELVDELMRQIAALLPEELRGEYAGQVYQKCEHIEFL
jgi:1-acyl-sn-glycerol-3-phosphate acyltransferase